MTLALNTAANTIITLNDLIMITNDRIACYERAMANDKNLDTETKRIFGDVIKEATNHRQQLLEKVQGLSSQVKYTATLSGILHRAWTDLKVALVGDTKMAIINSCLYNEEVALHTYAAALNERAGMSDDVFTLIQEQHLSLKKTYNLIKSRRETAKFYMPGFAYAS